MGTKTANFGLYKPDNNEFVNVDLDLNNNLDICDDNWKREFEYKYYNDPVNPDPVDGPNETMTPGDKYYSANTGAIIFVAQDHDTWEDVNGSIGTWSDFAPNLNGTYAGFGAIGTKDYPYFKYYDNGTGRSVKLSGKIALASGAELPLNTSTNVGTAVPAIQPVVDKVFLCYAGNSASYSVARLVIAASGTISFTRTGANVVDASQRWISLDGIRYSTDVAA